MADEWNSEVDDAIFTGAAYVNDTPATIDGDVCMNQVFVQSNIDGEVRESENCYVVSSTSPNASNRYVPKVDDDIKPVVGSVFDRLEDGVVMYERYAEASGFEVRRSTQRSGRDGRVLLKYIVCSREGICKRKSVDTLESKDASNIRSSNTQRTGCDACVKFRILEGSSSYLLYFFEDKHNHAFIKKENMHLCKGKRQLEYSDQLFIHRVSSSNVGASQAHKVMTAMRGGYSLVGASRSNFKNMRRDLNCYVGESDAQMIVEKLSDRKKYVDNFSFDFKTEEGELVGLFWADPTSKRNYIEFGDIVSFDATYQTNKYNMVFVPFTGVDNHRNCVSFGAGLIKRETVEMYSWLLSCFVSCFKKQPRLVVTDQDPAMKVAVDDIMKESKHRLCMWHIGLKLSSKVSHHILSNSDFKQRFHKLIWDMHMGPSDFEVGWHALIMEFNLQDHRWFRDMFNIRERWVSCFFKDVLLFGLMRTTSRSESENSFFNHFMYPGSTLISFMSCYEAAMEKQRHQQKSLDHQTSNTSPKFKTPLSIERHAAKIYTRKVFLKVQDEIYHAIWSCMQISCIVGTEDMMCCCIREKKVKNRKGEKENYVSLDVDGEDDVEDSSIVEVDHQVSFSKKKGTVACSCMMFLRFGLLCRHIFCVYRVHDVVMIPSEYVLRRWTRDIVPSHLLQKPDWHGETSCARDKIRNKMHSLVDQIVMYSGDDMDQLEHFLKNMEAMKEQLESQGGPTKVMKKADIIKSFVGCDKPSDLSIQNPQGIRNKGCGSSRRMIGQREKAVVDSQKPKRMCKNCNKMSTHDSRNCPLKFSDAQ